MKPEFRDSHSLALGALSTIISRRILNLTATLRGASHHPVHGKVGTAYGFEFVDQPELQRVFIFGIGRP